MLLSVVAWRLVIQTDLINTAKESILVFIYVLILSHVQNSHGVYCYLYQVVCRNELVKGQVTVSANTTPFLGQEYCYLKFHF